MSTEATAISEAMSPAEMAYFTSKGTDTTAFQPDTAPASQPAEQTAPQQPANDAQPNVETQQPAVNADDDEGIYIDADGKPRSVITGKFVPHSALHKERERRKSVEQENVTMREKFARAEERLAVLNEVIMQADAPKQQAAPQQEEAPDPEQDIFAYVKWQKTQMDKLSEQNRSMQSAQQQAAMSQQIQSLYVQDAQRFLATTPDFGDAYQHLANSYAQELRAFGYDDNTIKAKLQQEEGSLVIEALKRQKSPSQIIYERAKARGYTKKDAAPAAQQTPQQNADKLAMIQKGQKQTTSLSQAGGSSGEGLTVEALANMSEEEFEAVYKKMGKSKIRSYLGG